MGASIKEYTGDTVGEPFVWHGGEGDMLVQTSTWHNAVVTLQQNINGSFYDIVGASLSASGGIIFKTNANQLRIVVSSANSASVFYTSVQDFD
tara:strand:+ start:12592 stop:12870 length:279 start_codon:yes stop_codon:yes gene_type:complete